MFKSSFNMLMCETCFTFLQYKVFYVPVDILFSAILEEINTLRSVIIKEGGSSKKSCLALQRALILCQEIGDEKIALVQLITDHIENRARQLEQDREHLGE